MLFDGTSTGPESCGALTGAAAGGGWASALGRRSFLLPVVSAI
jgi:hypothetical protein